MKDIVIIANFCRDFSETDNGRFMYLCKELSKENSVEIITSDFSHGKKKHKDPLTIHWPFKITFLHEPGYKKNISLQRFRSHNAWGKEVERYLKEIEKPDIIYCAVPSLTAPLVAAKYCEKNNVRFVIDIQDLWPEAFHMIFKVPIISNIAFFPFRFRAYGIYSRADAICGVSRTYVNRALKLNKKVKSGHVVFLGTELATFDKYAEENRVVKPINELWLGYCGTLGASYDLTMVIDALAILKDKGVAIPKFIILGDGERKKEFEDHAAELNVDCLFTGRLPYNQMCEWLSMCDIVANPISHNAAQSIINKHGDYASSGLPVISTQENLEYRDLIGEYQMGFNCNNGDPKDFALKLLQLIENPILREQMGTNARKCAEDKFDRKNTYKEIIELITCREL